jgi:uncharacterized protein with NRDE domain
MCIAFWVLDAHPVYKFLLALNRDEFHSRPTLPVHRWPGQVSSFLLPPYSLPSYQPTHDAQNLLFFPIIHISDC